MPGNSRGVTTLGIDTSNYTTSVALYHRDTDTAEAYGRLLPVAEGALGLRQSDALFHHVKQLPALLAKLSLSPLSAIGVSARPRTVEGSYMPCFLAGTSAAELLGQALQVPVLEFSHQQGHLAAAAWSAGHPELLAGQFLAWHVSGGTTELLLVTPDPILGLQVKLIGGTEDLCAGQLVDRVGRLLGLPFPAGPALESLADTPHEEIPVRMRDTGLKFHLSGLQNKALQYFEAGHPKEAVARFTLSSILAGITNATRAAREATPDLPVLCAGGVMANARIKQAMMDTFGAYAAKPEFSRDNALGVAYLASGVNYE